MSDNFNEDDFEWGDGDINTIIPEESPAEEKPKMQQPKVQPTGLPNPNQKVNFGSKKGRNYDNNSGSKAQVSNGVEVNRGVVSTQDRNVLPNQNRPQKPKNNTPPQSNPRPQRTQQVNNISLTQNGKRIQIPVAENNQMNNVIQPEIKKKKSKLPLVFVAILLIISIVVGLKFFMGKKLEPMIFDYETSGKYAYDMLIEGLYNFDAENIDSLVGDEVGDSYIAQEWAYVNGVPLREEFITKVSKMVKFTYPQVAQLSTDGKEMVDDSGNIIKIESYMNNGESIKVTIPDYEKIATDMESDKDYIKRLLTASGYTEVDYTWNDEIADLMYQYLCDKDTLPTKEVEMNLSTKIGSSGKPIIESDADLDDALFGSDEFRNVCRVFSQICYDYTGYKTEYYTEKEEQHNPEYDKWLKLFNKYYEADNGKFKKGVSKWEPWYLRDDNNKFIYDKKGKKVVNYYSVKDKNGKDWIEPDKTILVDVQKERQVEDIWEEEKGILYNTIGTHYLESSYTGSGSKVFRVGDGSLNSPAGIGTTIITKVKCTDNTYADVRVALLGYWTNEDAIDYAEKFSPKNRGFTTKSVIQLITYEVQVENLENRPIQFESEMTLCDKNSNVSSRTGTMYEFSTIVDLAPKSKTIINDWATSTELEQKYICWGKSFNRQFSMVYFNVLAGTGDIPTYSAYEYFTGKSNIDGNIDIDVSDTNPAQTEVSTEATENPEGNTEESTDSEEQVEDDI